MDKTPERPPLTPSSALPAPRTAAAPSPAPSPAPPPPPLSLDWCLFLDVDGTLIELTDSPLQTCAGDPLKTLLGDLARRLSGAVALVSGRSIDYLDALFAPLRLPTSGLHGVERRTFTGDRDGGGFDAAPLDAARITLTELVHAHPGTLLEDKGLTIAVHYRLAPQFESVMREAVAAVTAMLGSRYHVQAGNMMLEIKPRGFSKGGAIARFMQEAPFKGRQPVFIGDDLTDLDGFEMVESAGGLSIGVGERVAGRYHLPDPAAVRAWLTTVAAHGA